MVPMLNLTGTMLFFHCTMFFDGTTLLQWLKLQRLLKLERELCADHDPEVMRGSICRAVEVSGEDLSHTVQALNT